jgi:hypothetical protein
MMYWTAWARLQIARCHYNSTQAHLLELNLVPERCCNWRNVGNISAVMNYSHTVRKMNASRGAIFPDTNFLLPNPGPMIVFIVVPIPSLNLNVYALTSFKSI